MAETNNYILEKIEEAWKKTCKVVLGGEIGDLEDYKEYLSEYAFECYPLAKTRSKISGKEVLFPGAPILTFNKSPPFISQDEIEQMKKVEIDINSIKDIDSLVEAVKESFVFCGNAILGNSQYCIDSPTTVDSSFCYTTHNTKHSKFVAFSSYARESSYVFGSMTQRAHFAIRAGVGEENKRVFESAWIYNCNDVYFCSNCRGCSDAMFCFGKINARDMIGNLQLEKSRYEKIKEHLLEQIRDELKLHKRCFSFTDLLFTSDYEKSVAARELAWNEDPTVIKPLNIAYQKTQKLLLGETCGDILAHRDYLLKGGTCTAVKIRGHNDKPALAFRLPPFPKDWSNTNATRLLPIEELRKHFNKTKAEESDIKDLEKMFAWLKSNALFSGEDKGKTSNVVDVCVAHDLIYSAWTGLGYRGKYIVGDALVDCSYAFGDRLGIYYSSHVIHATDSTHCKQCFEIDGCNNTSGAYYCHNCDGCSDVLFCFNIKGKRKHVANTPVSSDEFARVKSIIQQYVVEELKQKNDVDLNVYNITCWKGL